MMAVNDHYRIFSVQNELMCMSSTDIRTHAQAANRNIPFNQSLHRWIKMAPPPEGGGEAKRKKKPVFHNRTENGHHSISGTRVAEVRNFMRSNFQS